MNKLNGITKILIAAGISVAVFALLACSTSDSGPSTSDDSAVAAKGYKNPDRIVSVDWLNKHTSIEKHEIFAEKIIYSKEIRLAGSVDLIIHNKETNQYTIVDWKTNAKISTSAYRGKTGTHAITSNIEDCKYSVYSLQLSAYRYLLEEYYGLSIYRQFIVHLKDTESIAYLSPYYKDHIKMLFDLRKN